MGLDMCLEKRTDVQRWGHMKPEELHDVTVTLGGKPHPHIKPERVTCITEQVAYWRKANAIHKWFVDNVQDGEDNCGEYYVRPEQLGELVALCKQVLDSVETVEGIVQNGTRFYPNGRIEPITQDGLVVAQQGLADSLLPTQQGFFFGSTDYDEHYLRDLTDTVKQLEPYLKDTSGDYYYSSSW